MGDKAALEVAKSLRLTAEGQVEIRRVGVEDIRRDGGGGVGI